MPSKIWFLVQVGKPPANIIQNIRRDIHDFFWNYREIKTNRNTTMLHTEMEGLVIMVTKKQCEPTQCSIQQNVLKAKVKIKQELISCFGIWIKTEKQNKELASLIYKGYTDKEPILPTYRTFLSFETLAEISNELYFFALNATV